MEALVNRLAPGLTGRLSKEAARLVSEQRASGELSPFACHDASAIRRDLCDRDRDTLLRPAFVRDAEKIVHLPAYNRLAGKTQVFSFRSNDDLSRRGLHVQLVARVARDIGRALGLNPDLIEAIALGHDLGHTPFGHAGERFLNDVFHERTGRWFFHNVQSVRVMDELAGRNVSLQTLDGALCHNGEFEQQAFETSGLAEFDTFGRVVDSCWRKGAEAISHLRPMTLEGCVVRVSDIIAYVGKDRQDAICAGLCTEDTFDDGLGGAYNAWALSAFVADIVEHSVGRDRIEMSAEAFAEMRRAKRENYEKIYGAGEVNGDFSREVSELFGELYEHELAALRAGDESSAVFAHHVRPLERRLAHYGRTYDWESDPDQTVVDFISSMTDDYFMATCEAAFPHVAGIFPSRGYFLPGVRA
ncbi:deoxyguanosinetriphosphate triphosphohydrolase family protein [Thermophilibacter provencensis]|uniref:HD domain-containing protein n=1 Tax=Thermophilibacter provencensis TaxID=1852386 RepID=A0ABT7V487_9ACTN|nr:HD domain-containing protein [Thermophilibacter provencensis]MDM8271414.1 HD domain-containing protein [Thermophilibacter provencensis]